MTNKKGLKQAQKELTDSKKKQAQATRESKSPTPESKSSELYIFSPLSM